MNYQCSSFLTARVLEESSIWASWVLHMLVLDVSQFEEGKE